MYRNLKNNFTYEFWVKPEVNHQSEQNTNQFFPNPNSQSFVTGLNDIQHRLYARVSVSIGTNGISIYEQSLKNTSAVLVYETIIKNWVQISIVYYNKTPYLYINGELKKKGNRSKYLVVPSASIDKEDLIHNVDLQIRELRIWDHARSLDQIKENRDKTLSGEEQGLVSYWISNDYRSVQDNDELERIRTQYSDLKSYSEIHFPKPSENPLVSIIIPVYNQWNYTIECLKSIWETTDNIDYEIIIADDMSNDETVLIQDIVKNVTIVRDGVNRGFVLNCNHAAKFAKGKYILFLNNDTIVQKDWLTSLVELIEADEKIGIVGSKLLYSNEKLQEAGGIVWNDASGWNYGRLDDPEKSEYCYVKEVDYISGASMMIRSTLWRDIGGFDPIYAPAYCEDTDLAFEARKRGYKVVLQPKSLVIHFEGISHGNDINNGIKSYQTVNNKKFFEKWKSVLEAEHFPNAQHVFHARDRSRNQKTILVIDHYVPHYDQDAGSRTMYQYLKLFKKMGLNVKFAGDNFYRHEPYTTVLQQLGIEVLYGPWYAQNFHNWLQENGSYFDYIFLSRPHISIKYIANLRKVTNAKILYYGHDLHYLRNLREYELFQKEELLHSANHWKKIENQIFKMSDVVYYLSDAEITEINKADPQITTRTIPVYIFDHFEKNKTNFSDKSGLLFVGGFAHSPNVDAILWFVESIFPRILRDIPGIKLFIVGSHPPDKIKSLASENVVVTGFTTEDQLKKYYLQSKLVVVPLRYGAGVKGKVMEAMYYQVPIVTTSIGAEGYINAEHILTIADQPGDFAEKVNTLYNDVDLLNKLSDLSYEYVKANFSAERAMGILKNDILI